MARLKLLFVAVAVAALGGWHLSQRADGEASAVRRQADDRLRQAPVAVAAVLNREGQTALSSVKAITQTAALAQAMDNDGKPSGEALEAARAILEKTQSAEAERPVLIAILAQGTVGRYRVGQSNRFDQDLAPFAALSDAGALPRTGIAELDGETYRYAVAQFDDSKASGAKGLVAVGFPVDDSFAQRLLAGLAEMDLSIVQKGKVLASTLPPAERQALQVVASGAKGTIDFGHLTGERFVVTDLVPPLAPYLKLPLLMEGHRYRGKVLELPSVLPHDVKVIAAVRTSESYGEIADDQRELLAGVAILVLLCMILAFSGGNPARGLGRVVSAAERIVQGDLEARAPTAKMTALVRRAAVAINTLASHAELASKPSPPNLAEQLGIRTTRNPGSLVAIPTPLSQPPEPLEAPPAYSPSPASQGFAQGTPPPVSAYASSLPSVVTQPPVSYGAPSPSGKSSPSQEPLVLPQKPKPMTGPTVPSPLPAFQPGEALNEGNDATVIVQTPQALLRATQPSPSSPRPATASQAPRPSSVSPVPLPAATAAEGGEEAHFQQVYREFVATKEKCGEPAEGLTYEKFAAKLKKNQEQLVAKYGCRTVRFQVYVKEGKTALKAQPIR